MAEQAFLSFGILAVVLLVLAWRNGAFARRQHGEPDGSEAFPQVGARTQLQVRDPRAKLDAGDRLGRR